jgi:hypothetical protein
MAESRYLVRAGADWAVWDDVNGVLTFMTDAEAVENARENERELGDEFAKSRLPDDPKPEQAWAYVNELWEGDPGGRGWQVRVPAGATWLSSRDDEDDPARSRLSGSASRRWARAPGSSPATDAARCRSGRAPPQRATELDPRGHDMSVGDEHERLDEAMSELAARWYVRLLDAGIAQCERRDEPLTESQRFTLTAGQLALGDWRAPMPEWADGDA